MTKEIEKCKYLIISQDGRYKFCISRKMNEATGRYRCDFISDVDRAECIFYQARKKNKGGEKLK